MTKKLTNQIISKKCFHLTSIGIAFATIMHFKQNLKMKLDACSRSIILWLKEQNTVCIDDLICEKLIIEFPTEKIIKCLDWLKNNGLIWCINSTKDESPYILVPGGVEYSTAEWCLSELGAMIAQ